MSMYGKLGVVSVRMMDVPVQYNKRRPTRDACYVSKIGYVSGTWRMGGWMGGWMGSWLGECA